MKGDSGREKKDDDMRENSKPNDLRQVNSNSRHGLFVGTFILFVSFSFYLYLNNLYLVDQCLEGTTLRLPTDAEKLTIRVSSDKDSIEQLHGFVAQYASCLSVEQIQVWWRSAEAPPPESQFKGALSYSKTKFLKYSSEHVYNGYLSPVNESQIIPTKAVLFLDIDVFVSCSDLDLTLNIWRSAKDSIVGYFPRLMRPTVLDSTNLEILDPLQVWWHNAYSHMLPAGAMMGTHLLWTPVSDVLSRPQAQTTQALASSGQAAFLSTLDQNPECGPVAFYLFPQLFSALDAPVWVDVRPSIVGPPSTQALSSSQRGHCATVLSRSAGDAAGAKQIKYSRHKGTRASSRLFW